MESKADGNSSTHQNMHAVSLNPPSHLSATLKPTPMVPVHLRKGVKSAQRIDQIEWIEITDALKSNADGEIRYNLIVFTNDKQRRFHISGVHNETKLKRERIKLVKPTRTEPDCVVHRTLSEFANVQRAIVDVTVEQSHAQYCRFCNEYQSLLLLGSIRMAMSINVFRSVDNARETAEGLVRAAIEEFQSRQPGSRRHGSCLAVYTVALMLDRFLFAEDIDLAHEIISHQHAQSNY